MGAFNISKQIVKSGMNTKFEIANTLKLVLPSQINQKNVIMNHHTYCIVKSCKNITVYTVHIYITCCQPAIPTRDLLSQNV